MDIEKLMSERERLQRKVESMERTIAKRRIELEEIDTALKVFEKFTPNLSPTAKEASDELTIMDMIVNILKNKTGLTSSEILEEIHKIYNPELARTSMSPQLSRLKFRKIIIYKDNRWWINEEPTLK